MRLNIFIKFFLTSTLSIIIPLIIAAGLIIFGYQEAIDEFLIKQKQTISGEIIQDLFLTLANFKIQVILTLFVIILLSLFSSLLLARSFTRPLKKIIEGIREVTKGNLNFVIETKSKDELGELVKYFNEMTQQLKITRSALEEAKATLEIRVAARTKELEGLAESREEVIKERTKELQERIDELETLHRLAVDRELKMVELKKEIKALKAQFKNKNYGTKKP